MTKQERYDTYCLVMAMVGCYLLAATTIWWVGFISFMGFLIVDHWVRIIAGDYE